MAMPTPDQVVAVLRRYKVHLHYRATSSRAGCRYAVFDGKLQFGQPTTHREAHERRDALVAGDLIRLFGAR